jgi:outer membrane protein assembly factor BamB
MKRNLKICLGLALISILSGCSVFGGDTPLNQPSALPQVSQQWPFTPSWQVSVPTTDQHSLPPRLAYTDGKIIVANSHGLVTAVAAKDGSKVWQTNSKLNLTSLPGVDQAHVVLGSADGHVICLSAIDGKVLWDVAAGNQILAAPSIVQDKVYLKTVSGEVYALQLQTGKKIWNHSHLEPQLILRRASQPLVADKLVLVGFADGQVVALNKENGKVIWSQTVAEGVGVSDVERMVDIDANLVLSDDIVYVATFQGHVAALLLDNGQSLWDNSVSTYQDTVLSKALFAVDDTDKLLAFAPATGEPLWEQRELRYRQLTAPAVWKNYLLLADGQGYLHLLSQSQGKPLTYVRVSKAKIATQPLVIDNQVIVLSDNGRLNAYSAAKEGLK